MTGLKQPPRQIEEVLVNQAYYKLLIRKCKDYMLRVRRVNSKASSVKGADTVVCLLDFDVILEFIMRSSDSNSIVNSITWFFYESNIKYGIPQGAYEEFYYYWKDTLKFSTKLGDISTLSGSAQDRKQTIESLAKNLNISNIEKKGPEKLVEEMTQILDHKIYYFHRLQDILTNKRFVGLKRDYSVNDVNNLLSIINSVDQDKKRHNKQNVKDAKNLAIVLKQNNNLNLKANQEAFILVSNTRILCKLPDILHSLELNDSIKELASLLGIEEAREDAIDDYHLEQIREKYLVIKSNFVKEFYYLDFFENIKSCAESSKTSYTRIREIINSVEQLKYPSESPDSYDQEAQIKVLVKNFKGLVEIDSENRDFSGFLRYQHVEENLDFIASSRKRQMGSGDSSNTSLNLKSKNLELVGCLEEVGFALEFEHNEDFLEYKIESNRLDNAIEFKVLQFPKVGNNEVLTGTATFDPKTKEINWYSAIWKVCCTEMEFLKAVGLHFLNPIEEKSLQDDIKFDLSLLSKTSEESRFWQKGILFYTEDEIWATEIPSDFNANVQNRFRLEAIFNLIKKERKKRGDNNYKSNFIKQYRINTPSGDFTFDIEPPDSGISTRYCAILSHKNILPSIKGIHNELSCHYSSSTKLTKCLNEFFSGYKLKNV